MKIAVTKTSNKDIIDLTIGGEEYKICPAIFTDQDLTELLIALVDEIIDDKYVKQMAIERIYLGMVMKNMVR